MLLHYGTKPYIKLIPNFNLSKYFTKFYTMLIQYRIIPSLNTLPNYTPTQYISEYNLS